MSRATRKFIEALEPAGQGHVVKLEIRVYPHGVRTDAATKFMLMAHDRSVNVACRSLEQLARELQNLAFALEAERVVLGDAAAA